MFADWKFSNTDFEAIPLNAEDFVYADPPYDLEFRQYAKDASREISALWFSASDVQCVLKYL